MSFLAFLFAAVVLAVTPGPGIAYVAARTVAGGRPEGLSSCLGTGLGGMAHVLAAALGLSVLVMQSAIAFALVKYLGAAYLVYLGVRMLTAPGVASGLASGNGTDSARAAFREGALVNVLNPKVALFFLALMPQFIEPTSDTKVLAFLALGLTFVATGIVWCLVLAVWAGRARHLLTMHPPVLHGVSRIAGGLFILLGLRLAASRQ